MVDAAGQGRWLVARVLDVGAVDADRGRADEALAVGDKDFRAKSAARIQDIVSGAGTLMLVSHSMDEIKRMCGRVLWVEQGELIADGPTDDVLAEYAKA